MDYGWWGCTSSGQHGQRCLLGHFCAASAARRWRWPLLQVVYPESLKQCDCYECGMEVIQAQAKWRWLRMECLRWVWVVYIRAWGLPSALCPPPITWIDAFRDSTGARLRHPVLENGKSVLEVRLILRG